MNKIIFLFLSCLIILKASSNNEHLYILKKDQIATIKIKKNYPPTIKKEGVLKFRWTLYKANKLVLLVDYEGFKNQYLLEKRYGLDRVKIRLISDFYPIKNETYAIIIFKDFKNKRAYLRVFIKDPKKRLKVRFK